MKAAIVVFSPSGNTDRVGKLLQTSLEKNNINVQLVNITKNDEYFLTNDKQKFLSKVIKEHDILFIGSPVYAHHLQYHVKDLIKSLPFPSSIWGQIAIPFVTFGGISSGIALEEAGTLLRKRGRKILAGIKISSSHRMTRAFMKEEYNKNQPEEKIIYIIERLVKHIKSIDLNSKDDYSKHLKYQNRTTYLKANTIFKEKIWHEKRYPKIVIDITKCVKCGKCVTVCAVCHLKKTVDHSIIRNTNSPCVHCFNCLVECPQKAIYADGDLEKAKSFMSKMIKKGKESPDTYLYPNL